MASSLSNHVNNLAEGIHTVKWKYRHDNKKCETCGFKYKNCMFCPERKNFRDDLNVYVVTRIMIKCLMKTYRNNFLIHTNFLTMI